MKMQHSEVGLQKLSVQKSLRHTETEQNSVMGGGSGFQEVDLAEIASLLKQ